MYKVNTTNVEIHQEDLNRVAKKQIAWATKEELIEAAEMKNEIKGVETVKLFESERLEEASKFYENKTKYKVFTPQYMNVGKYWLLEIITLIEEDEDWGDNEISSTYL